MIPPPPKSTLFPYTTLFRSRIELFHKFTEPVIDYYKQKGILAEIDGEKGIEEIHKEIMESLQRKHVNVRSEEHTSELQSHSDLVCRLLLEKKKKKKKKKNIK